MEYIIWATGLTAVGLTASSQLLQNEATLRIINASGLFVWALYFSALGQFSAVWSLGLAIGILMSGHYKLTALNYLLLGLQVVLAGYYLATDSLLAALPFISGTILNYAFSNMRGVRLTITALIGQTVWLGFAIPTEAHFSTFSTVLAITALLVRMYNGWKAKSKLVLN